MPQRNKYIAALVTAILGIGIITWFKLSRQNSSDAQGYDLLDGAVVMVFEILAMLAVGLILLISGNTKPIGQGVLIGMGITSIIGFGICSAL